MKFLRSFVLLLSFCALAAPLRADIFAALDSSGAQVKQISEGDLSTDVASLGIANLRAMAVGDVLTSPGVEIVVAYGVPSILEVRSADGTQVLLSRDFGADAEGGTAGGGPTGYGPETINDLAIGECRSDLGGLEIAVASVAPASTQGFVRVLNAQSGSLEDRSGTGSGLNVSAVAIADVNTRQDGGELVFCWQYEPNGSTYNTQIAVYTPRPDIGFTGNTIRNVEGFISPQTLVVEEALNDGGAPEIFVGTDLGQIHLFQASTAYPGNAGLLSYAGTDPANNLRAGFENVKALAIGNVDNTAGNELIVFSTDTEGALRFIDANSAGLSGDLFGNSDMFADVFAIRAYNTTEQSALEEVIVASPDNGGSLLLLSNTAATLDSRTSMGTWIDLDNTAAVFPNAVRTLEWSLY